jgi:hypothetical protein
MQRLKDTTEDMLATPESIVEALSNKFPDSLPTAPTKWEQFARLQGRQDVIRYLNGLINNTK